jgi:hypothetical protein
VSRQKQTAGGSSNRKKQEEAGRRRKKQKKEQNIFNLKWFRERKWFTRQSLEKLNPEHISKCSRQMTHKNS